MSVWASRERLKVRGYLAGKKRLMFNDVICIPHSMREAEGTTDLVTLHRLQEISSNRLCGRCRGDSERNRKQEKAIVRILCSKFAENYRSCFVIAHITPGHKNCSEICRAENTRVIAQNLWCSWRTDGRQPVETFVRKSSNSHLDQLYLLMRHFGGQISNIHLNKTSWPWRRWIVALTSPLQCGRCILGRRIFQYGAGW